MYYCNTLLNRNYMKKHTNGPWSVNHWNNNGTTGVTCHGQKNGVSYFSGDAVKDIHYKVVGHRDMNSTLDGSFEGLHIAEIHDRGPESMANAKLIAAAPHLFDLLSFVNDAINADVKICKDSSLHDDIRNAIKNLS